MIKVRNYFYTIRYLKLRQVFYRCVKKFYKPKIPLQIYNVVLSLHGNLKTDFLVPLGVMWSGQQMQLLNKEEKFNNQVWTQTNLDKLWLYNLHYFAYIQLPNIESREAKAMMLNWIENNSSFLGVGWESYPTSLRIINWIKYILVKGDLDEKILTNLYLQARFLNKNLEYHILGNHLFENAKALIFVGLFFQGKEPSEWLKKGIKIFKRELQEQILKDGGHFELSPMYQATILEGLLDLYHLEQIYQKSLLSQQEWQNLFVRMFFWLNTMTHPDGRISFFNDCAFNIAHDYFELRQYAKKLGLSIAEKSQRLIHLRDSGYIRVKQNNITALLDVAKIGPDYLPGHAHADTLSFELSVGEARVFVNSGCYSYSQMPERQINRSTAAHNTLVFEGTDSSQIWGSFRVARRAYPFNLFVKEEADAIEVSCAHTGYKYLKGKPIHKRSWIFHNKKITVNDELIGPRDFNAQVYYHLSPHIKEILALSAKEVLIQLEDSSLRLSANQPIKVEKKLYSAEFNKKEEHFCLSIVMKEPSLVTELTWR